MATSFSALRKSRRGNLDKLVQRSQQEKSGGMRDERFWNLTRNKEDAGSATIRFLPAPKGEEVPWVKIWSHFFRGPGGVYAENSLTTLGKEDPVSEYNSTCWAAGRQDEARERKRKLEVISNILVVNDPANPDNNGKVFLFKYGVKIFEKLEAMWQPKFEDQDPADPFDFWEGNNFKLRVKRGAPIGNTGRYFPNYDDSVFEEKTSAISDSDEEIEKIWLQQHSLQRFVDPSNFKNYADLKARMYKVLGISEDAGPTASTKTHSVEERSVKPAKSEPEAGPVEENDDVPWSTDEMETDYDIIDFQKLAEES